ncbi:hypothetical protein [Mycobacterium hippophais]|nr:hypothetical protein [Mycobacterium hippophais]
MTDDAVEPSNGESTGVEAGAGGDGPDDTGVELNSEGAVSSSSNDDPTPTRDRLTASPLMRFAGYAVLLVFVTCLTAAAAYFRYHADTAEEVDAIRAQSVQVATEGTIDMLSYTPDNVEAKLNSAGERLTGSFKDSYLTLVRDTVIPGAKQKSISADATVPAGSSVSATRDTAKVLLFVNQGVTVGGDGPTETASVVELDLENIEGRWLISGFEPR